MVYPPLYKARVRSLQMHGASVEELLAGSRAAVNLQGLEKEEMERGMVVATRGPSFPPAAWMRSSRSWRAPPGP